MRWLLLAAISTAAASGQYHRAERLTFPSPFDGADVPYTFYAPAAVNFGQRYPLLIGLHGAGQNERLMMRRIFGRGNLPGESDLEASRVVPPLPDVEFFVACPFARVSNYWSGFLAGEVMALVARLSAEYPIDPRRVYLTGIAEGAGGAIAMTRRYPGAFASVAGVAPMMPPGPTTAGVPVRLYQGALDPRVPVDQTRELAAALGGELIEFPAAKHNAWDPAYARAGVFAWFTQRSTGGGLVISDGGIAEAFASKHLYVYGDGRQEDAERAAEWSRTVRLPTRADDQVTDTDRAAANLILFGTKETNREIARIADQMPLELSSSAADYGLMVAVRTGERTVVISSGLPWWNRGDPPWRAVPASDDFVLFKGTAENVVARGRLDAGGKIPSDIATALTSHVAVRAKLITPDAPAASTPSSRAVPSGRPGSRSTPRPPAKKPSPRPPVKNE